MAATYYECDGSVSISSLDSSALQCSTGWTQVTALPLIDQASGDDLMGAIMYLVVIVACWRLISRAVSVHH